MSQAQPVIPVTMPYGDNGAGRNMLGHLSSEINRSANHVMNDVNRSAEHVSGEVGRGVDWIRGDVNRTSDHVAGEVHRGVEWIRGDVNRGNDAIKQDINQSQRDAVALINSQSVADQSQTRASQIETRQAVERNADYLNNNINNSSTQGLLANQNASTQGLLANQLASTQGLLATQTTATATQLAVQNTSADQKNAIGVVSAQSERIAGETRGILYNQTQTILTDNKVIQLQQLESKASIQLQASDNKSLLGLQASENRAQLGLQASEYKASSDLQASMYKAYLENHITKTASDGILKSVELNAKLMEKIAECCCESKMGFGVTQQLIVQTAQNSQSAGLQQALHTAQNEALVARIAAAVKGSTVV